MTTTDESPAWDAVRISSRWDTARRQIEASQHLKVADGRMLWLLRDGQVRTLRQIAEELHLEQSTVNRQVNAALETGLLTRSRANADGAYQFTGTAVGRQKFTDDILRHIDVQTQALARIPAEERETFIRNLGLYVEGLNIAASPGCAHAQADQPR